jgi:hypothetical protein
MNDGKGLVAHQKHGEGSASAELFDDRLDGASALRIQGAGGLVEEEHFGFEEHGPEEAQALFLTDGKGAGRAVQGDAFQEEIPESGVQNCFGRRPDVKVRLEGEGQQEVFAYGAFRHYGGLLEVADGAAKVRGWVGFKGQAIEPDGTSVGKLKAVQQSKQRGFAGSGRSADFDQGSGFDDQVDPAEDRPVSRIGEHDAAAFQ